MTTVTRVHVATDRFGELDVSEDRVLTFPDGIPGFPDARQFALIEARDGDVVFWLQSLDDPGLAFLAAVPWPFFPDYEPVVTDDDQEALGIDKPHDAMVLCLLTVNGPGDITANLFAPIVVNSSTRVGRQLVLTESEHPLRAPLPTA